MTKPLTLVILAAGHGSRFGGNKQFAGFGPRNVTLMILNALAAYKAGFRHLVFVISQDSQAQFEQQVMAHLPQDMHVDYAVQSNDSLPENNMSVSLSERTKPLGTAHALWCCHPYISGPFVVTNADDFYGNDPFTQVASHFRNNNNDWCMIAYPVKNTMSAHGGVNRGLCQCNEHNQLISVQECFNITLQGDEYVGHVNHQSIGLNAEQLVSMNCHN